MDQTNQIKDVVKNVVVIIMAGGLGKRMNSDIPKVLHKIKGISMINHILLKLKVLQNLVNLKKIFVVVGKYEKQIKKAIEEVIEDSLNITYINQPEPLGTGHAIQCCKQELLEYNNADVLILSGDVPLLSIHTMLSLLDNRHLVKIITANLSNPDGYGRVVIKDGIFDKIVEQKDCDLTELNISNINCGIYAINSSLLCKYLSYLKNENKQKEYYLTDIIEIIKREENTCVGLFEIESHKICEIIGVNTSAQLQELENLIEKN